MTAYYNEVEPFAAQWLRNLIAAGRIAPGDVDERSIEDVRPGDIKGYTQCHFFAGIGGWSRALRLAGWPDDRPVWTGSCPCQPFSAAGKGAGFADERHLWPVFHRLIDECRPGVVFGEQVASKAGLEWLDLVQADLEASGYANAAVDICAASVGAPHIRQRLWWVADTRGERRDGFNALLHQQQRDSSETARSSMVHHHHQGLEGLGRPEQEHGAPRREDSNGSAWVPSIYVSCQDGKSRLIEPGLVPLAHGIPERVGRLRGYGNAIVPQVAAQFIRSYIESCVTIRG